MEMHAAEPALPSASGEGEEPLGRIGRLLVLAVVITGTFMAVLDMTIVNVALPNIMTSFGVNVKEVQWISTGFFIATAVGMPLTGWLGRRMGLGRLFVLELGIFTVGSLLCSMAWSLDWLIFARVLQALGAGAIMPSSIAIITDTFPPGERGRALGLWGIGFMVGPAIGPTLGGFLTEWFSWRSIFAINLPVGVVAFLFALLALRPGRAEHGLPFDWKGYGALAVFLIAGLLTLERGQDEGWTSSIILFGAGLTVASFGLFLALVWDAPDAVMPVRLFASLDFSLSVLLGFLRSAAMFGPFFLLPLFLQNVQGRDTIDTGLLMVPTALTVAVSMPISGWLTDRFGARWPSVAGFLIAAYSQYLFAHMDPLMGRWSVIYPQLWRGVGVALIMTPINVAAMNSVARIDAGVASWMVNLTQSVGGAATIAVLSTLLYRNTLTQMDQLGMATALHTAPPAHLVQRALLMGYSPTDSGAAASAVILRQLSQAATTLAFQQVFALLAVATLAGLVPALLLSTRQAGARRG
jgi:EmrB/QacA subfamily drug resistance transporter